MKRLTKRQFEPRYLGLKKHNYLLLLLILVIIFIILIVGRAFKVQELKTLHFAVKSEAYAKEIKDLKTYTKPSVNLEGRDKAISIIKQIWRKDWKTGVAIARCESGYREKVVNSIGATGYFQILAPVHNVSIEAMQEGYANTGFAYSLFVEQGLTPWVSSKECWSELI